MEKDLRCRFSVDDSIWFLRDIGLYASGSIFDNGFLRFWRNMHEAYGLKVQFNVYYEDLDTGWTLLQMPDRFRKEWLANADWIRLTFHARADRPDMPYAQATYKTVARDFRLVTREIIRFAGPDLLSKCTTLHWGAATREGCRALRDNGIEALVGYFELRDGMPWVSYYLDPEQTSLLNRRDMWRDETEGLLFIRHDMVVNLYALEEVVPHLERVYTDTRQNEILELMIHEQYFYPRFEGYQPDAAEKVRRAAEWVVEHGYRGAFYEDWKNKR
jgi:hypothetical protein